VVTITELSSLIAEKHFDLVEAAWQEALRDPAANTDVLLAACKGLAKAGQKSRLQTLASQADAALKAKAKDPALARFRWELLKEAVKAGATPSTTEGFHKLFEEALARAYPGKTSINSLLGRFKFRESKTPLDGMARLEKAEKWLPFEVGEIVAMAGRGAGKVIETNFTLESVRVDFEKNKGVAVPIGVAVKSLTPLPEGHYLREKLLDPASVVKKLKTDPGSGFQWIWKSFGKKINSSDLKEAVQGLLGDDGWTVFWSALRKHPQVIVHGTGRTAWVEWTDTVEDADSKLLQKFEKAPLAEQIDFYKKNVKRSTELTGKLARALAREAWNMTESDPAGSFEIAVLVDKIPEAPLGFDIQELVPEALAPFLAKISDRQARERALEIFESKFPDKAAKALAEWFFKEEEGRTLDQIDRRLSALDPALREQSIDRLLKNPRLGPKAFFWFAQRASSEESFRIRLTSPVLSRLIDSVSWNELSGVRSRLKEMFDRTGLAAIWLVKTAKLEEARTFLDALARHNDLEEQRVTALVKAAEMRFPELRKAVEDDTFFATVEAILAKKQELETIITVEIPENRRGIATAAAEGDLSENFEYKARRDKQQLLSARAGQLQQQLRHVRKLDPSTVDPAEVRVGTKITFDSSDGSRCITLLGPWDSKPDEGIYSYQSELGKAILGKKVGEEVDAFGQKSTIAKIEVWR
jgi:transcription elongation GreA/GreB family factor